MLPEFEDEYEWYLGGDYDCETCGMTWNRVSVELDEDTKTWGVIESVGCYGGNRIDSRDSDAWDKLQALYKYLYEYPDFDANTAAEITGVIQTARARWARDDYLILAQRVAHENKEFMSKLGEIQ